MQHLIQSDWELNVHHAREEVRKEYLAPLEEEERDNLLRLAALPEDCFLPSEALAAPYARFDICIKKGLVFETEHGIDKYVRFSLVHSSLGKLLLAAANPAVDRKVECCAVARLSTFAGFVLAKRSAEEAEEELARSIFQAIVENPDWLNNVSVRHLPSNLRTARHLGIDLLPVGHTVPALVRDHLVKAALGTQLHFLVTFLTYARSTESGLTKLHEALVADLVEHPKEMADRARKTALGDLVTFLTYACSRESGLTKLHEALVADLVQHPKEMADRARKTALRDLVTFLTYACSRESGLTKLHEALVADLVEHPKEMADRARKTALGDLVTFLTYACSRESGLTKLHEALVADLVEHPKEMADRACEAPLDQLVTFLNYARSETSGFLAADSNFAHNVCNSIDLEAWNYRRAKEKPQQPSFALNVQKLFTVLGRPELVVAVARTLIHAADPKAWHAPVIGIHHLSSMIRVSIEEKQDHLARFLERIVVPQWLDKNYSQASQGGLAGSWFAIATNLPPELHSRFVTPSLHARLDRDLTTVEPGRFDTWDTVFSMIGSATLLGAIPTCSGVKWPDDQALGQIVTSRRPADSALGSLQLQFWCGLREMARQRANTIKVPPGEGKIVLASWRNLQPRTRFAVAFNASMITWLERCETSDWTLDRCNAPIREDIVGRLTTA